MPHQLQRMVITATLALAAAGALAAQSGSTGIIQGRVRDSAGRVIAQAEISAAHQDGFTFRQTASDSRGAFRLGFLPPGRYRMTARRIGYRAVIVSDVVVRAGRVEEVALVLPAAALALDSIVVEAAAVRLNRSDTESGSRLTARELALLPLPNDARDLVAFTPGARPDQIWGAATAQANNYQLDGVAVNHPGIGGHFLEPATSWIEEIEVKGLGAGAEYGNFQGGLVNIVTKSGSNRFQGALKSDGESRYLNGSNLRVTEAGSEPSHRAELDGQLRGPLLRDRLHFAAFGQLVDRGARVLNRVRQVAGDFAPEGPAERELKLLGKLTWQAGRKDIVNASFGRNDLHVARFGLNGFQSAEATQRRDAATTFYNLSWQRTWSPRNFLELKLAGFDGSDRREPYAGAAVPGVATLLEVSPREYQNAAFRERREPASLGLALNWDVYVKTLGAEHHLKLGGEHGYGSWIQQRLRNGGLTWRPGERLTPPVFDPANPATWVFNGAITSSWGGEANLDGKVQNSAAYLQDYIQVSRWLSINPGLRWGRWVGRLRRADGGDYFTPVRDNGFDPRIGAVVDLSGSGTLLAKAHWGIFHQSMFAAFFDRAEGGGVYSNEERWEYRGPGFSDPRTTFTTAERNGNGAAWQRVQTIRLNEVGRVENFKEPYLEQATLGVEQSFGGRIKAEALYVRRRNKNMVAIVDRNIAQNYTVYENITVLDRFFRPVIWRGAPLVLPKLAVSNEDIIFYRELVLRDIVDGRGIPPGFGTPEGRQRWLALRYQPDNVLTNVPEAVRKFDQLQLVATASYPSWWAQASASFTQLRGNLNSLTGTDDYTTANAGPFVRLNEQFNSYGDLNNQSRFELKLQAGGKLRWGFKGGAFLTHFAGDRVTPTLTLSDLLLEFALPDTASSGAPPIRLRGFFFSTVNGQRIFVEPRGTLRYPGRTSLDLHLERGFPLGRAQLNVMLDAFNALGAATITEVQTSVNGSLDPDFASAYGGTRNRMAPRTLRVGVGVTW
jgi:carboxypeptidase family protein/TonB-dependent receptor-like protein